MEKLEGWGGDWLQECWVVGRWLQVWDGYQSAGPPPPLGFPVGHWKVEQGSLAIPPFLKAPRVVGRGGSWRHGRGWGAPGAGRKEEEGLAGRA